MFAQVKIDLKKNSCKKKSFLQKGHFEQTPPIIKKMGSTSEKYKFANIFSRFFQCGQFSLYKPKSIN